MIFPTANGTTTFSPNVLTRAFTARQPVQWPGAISLRPNSAVSRTDSAIIFSFPPARCCSWYGSNAHSWTLTVDELREWLHIDDGELVKVNHLKSRVIDQARHELDSKARISFKAEVQKQGRKIVGWKFKVVDNRPTGVSQGAVRLPDIAAEDEKRKTSDRMNGLRLRWTGATEEERAPGLD